MDKVSAWDSDEFEYAVECGLVACYENRIKKITGVMPRDRFSEQDLLRLRSDGLHISCGNQRWLMGDAIRQFKSGELKGISSKIPNWYAAKKGFIYHIGEDNKNGGDFSGYVVARGICQLDKFPAGVMRTEGGLPYELTVASFSEDGTVKGQKHYFSIKDEKVFPAYREFVVTFPGELTKKVTSFEDAATENGITPYHQIGLNGAYVLQVLSELPDTWSITATDGVVKCSLAADTESVKSVLYARSAPLTGTGRLKPILHVVSSHKRRKKSGVEVDIKEFIRGTRSVEIGGMTFTVNPPREYLKDQP